MLYPKYIIYKKDPILYFSNVVIVKNLDNIINISCTERRCINRPCNFDVDHFACQRESKDVFIASQYLSWIRDTILLCFTVALTKERIVVVDRRRNHKASRYCYRIWNIRAFSQSKVPDRKFFCCRQQWIKCLEREGRGRSILRKEHCAAKVFFLRHPCIRLCVYTHVEAYTQWVLTT